MNATAEKGKWATLGKKLKEAVLENSRKTRPEKKSLQKIFEEFAEVNDTTFGSASQYYYTEIRPNLKSKKEPNQIDRNIDNLISNTRVESAYRNVKERHKIGEVVEITVTSIQNFGVFGKTDDGYEGLIHISQITGNEYVTLPEDYFYVGERVKAKIVRFEGEDKLSFSTRAIGGRTKINPAFRDLASQKNKPTDEPVITEKPVIIRPEVKKIEPKSKPLITSTKNNDKDNIIQFIKRYSDNNVSPKALGDIDELISQFGVFQTTISLMETVRDLDISSFITEMTKERLKGEYLRQR